MMTDRNDKNTPFKIISLLLQGYFSKEEIKERLGISNAGFYKSLFKIRKAGFDVASSKVIYRIKGYNNKLLLNDYDKSILAHMLSICCLMLPDYKMNSFKNLIRRLMFFAQEDDYDTIIKRFQFFKKMTLTSEFREKVRKLRECMCKNGVIKVILHSGRVIMMEPKKFDWEKERIYLYYMNRDGEKEFQKYPRIETMRIERIAKIVQEDEEDYIPQEKEVVFELKGKLAESYLLKRDERVINSTKDGSIVVASGTQDKEALFKRLLRYDTLCKVLFPKEDVKNFNKMIDRAISNLGPTPELETFQCEGEF